MNESRTVDDIIRLLGPGQGALPTYLPKARAELTVQLQKYMHTLGPTPKRCLETFADLGLSDAEIGRYFRIPYDIVTQLREIWKIDGRV
ncbi:hypothetical protein N9801_01215 [Yoonia sp.]|uniref:hypothetical protein n=1 Tax=Yoonia sp. TaxID=2212373 RepID=UPI0023261E5D|nr:hypothetical protein [Yoonia sp.]MDA9979813.1 hypothetical protein [Yoonia sp.]MDB4240867.1 hypothetical protein [Yoonia sp.]